jgi:SAM-dependent methyltransferase
VIAGTVAEHSHWPESIFRSPGEARLRLVGTAEAIQLPVRRWHGPMLLEEVALLDSVVSPVLDVGCGPGRHASALARAGHTAVGIDTSAAAVESARERGATALQLSVFGPVPNQGRWATVLLLDGNIGIGGDPVRLLARIRELAAPRARVLVEVGPPGSESRRFHARVQHGGGLGPGFPWACVGAGGIGQIAEAAGLRTVEVSKGGGRWFVKLEKPSY